MSLTLAAGPVTVQLVKGDIAAQDVDAIVVPTDASLSGEGEVASWILAQGGEALASALAEARATSTPVRLSQHVLTTGGALPARNVLHTVGPVWADGYGGEFVALERVYLYGLERAIADGFKSIAFASVSTGANGMPDDRAAYVAFNTFVRELREKSGNIEEVRFVVKDEAKFAVYSEIFAEVKRTMMG